MTAIPNGQAQVPEKKAVAKFLIVDDNTVTALALARLLTSADFQTEVSFRGDHAIAYAIENPLSGALIDIHLPDINGLVLSKRLREILGPDKPIVVLSGDTSMEIINSLPHVGATYFFSKPVNARDLLDRLKEWTSNPA